MKLLIYSDLHNEFTLFKADDAACNAADVVILAGDIDLNGRSVEWATDLSSHYAGKPVVLVAGNHEFYGGHFKQTIEAMRQVAEGSNVHVLENEAVTLCGARFLGCSLWTDFALNGNSEQAADIAWQNMTDYRAIAQDAPGNKHRPLTPADTQARHRQSCAWIKQQLSAPFGAGPTVVVTHHAPSARSLPVTRQGAPLSPAYASNLEALLGDPVALWIHGHIHTCSDYTVHGTRVVCNPRGYVPAQPNPEFQPARLLTL